MELALSPQAPDDTLLPPDGRQGHDEGNLGEFPLVLLAKRPPDGVHTIEYCDHDRHPRTGAPVLRKVTITGASKYGLPTIHDEDVLMALIYLTLTDKKVNGFADTTVLFTRRQLLQVLGWADTGDYYDRLKKSIRRWKGVNVAYENWWDHVAQEYIPEIGFSLLDNYKFTDGRRKEQPQLFLPLDDEHPQRSLCSVTWNKTPFTSFKNGYLTTLDLDAFFRLPTAAAKRAYRYLNLRLPASGIQDFDLQAFACQHVGFSTSYKPSRLRSEVQKSIVGPLEKNEFIEAMPPQDRFQKRSGRDRIVFARKATSVTATENPTALLPLTEGTITPASSRLVRELTSRSLGGKLAAKFVADYPGEYLEQKVDYFDFTLTTEEIKKPGAWLRRAIEEDYGQPSGYLPREEREQNAAAVLKAKQEKDERHRREKEQKAKADAEEAAERKKQKRDTDYWESLTTEQKAELDAASIAVTDAETLAQETGLLKKSYQTIRRNTYIRQLLDSRESKHIEA